MDVVVALSFRVPLWNPVRYNFVSYKSPRFIFGGSGTIRWVFSAGQMGGRDHLWVTESDSAASVVKPCLLVR